MADTVPPFVPQQLLNKHLDTENVRLYWHSICYNQDSGVMLYKSPELKNS